jgi:hypothetical protein
MDFSQKQFCAVFELTLLRNAQKRTKTKPRGEKSRLVGGWVWDLANARGVRRFVFAGPSYLPAYAYTRGVPGFVFCRLPAPAPARARTKYTA